MLKESKYVKENAHKYFDMLYSVILLTWEKIEDEWNIWDWQNIKPGARGYKTHT